jgi:hypothetical protein
MSSQVAVVRGPRGRVDARSRTFLTAWRRALGGGLLKEALREQQWVCAVQWGPQEPQRAQLQTCHTGWPS